MTGLLIERMNDDIAFQNPEDISIEELQEIEGDDWYSLLCHEPLLARFLPSSHKDAIGMFEYCLEYPYHCLEEDFDEIDEEEYEEYDNDDEYDDGLFDDDFFYFVSDEIYSDFFGDTLEDDFKEDYHYGLLKTNGYSVGKSSGLSLIDRRIILIETSNDELPHDVGLSPLAWGDPRTFVRLKRIADIINFHLQNAKDKSIQVDADVSQSIWDWQNDLAWLKAEFYDSIYDQLFQWPSGQI